MHSLGRIMRVLAGGRFLPSLAVPTRAAMCCRLLSRPRRFVLPPLLSPCAALAHALARFVLPPLLSLTIAHLLTLALLINAGACSSSPWRVVGSQGGGGYVIGQQQPMLVTVGQGTADKYPHAGGVLGPAGSSVPATIPVGGHSGAGGYSGGSQLALPPGGPGSNSAGRLIANACMGVGLTIANVAQLCQVRWQSVNTQRGPALSGSPLHHVEMSLVGHDMRSPGS